MIEFKFYFKRGMATMKQLEQTALDAQILRVQKKIKDAIRKTTKKRKLHRK